MKCSLTSIDVDDIKIQNSFLHVNNFAFRSKQGHSQIKNQVRGLATRWRRTVRLPASPQIYQKLIKIWNNSNTVTSKDRKLQKGKLPFLEWERNETNIIVLNILQLKKEFPRRGKKWVWNHVKPIQKTKLLSKKRSACNIGPWLVSGKVLSEGSHP